MWCQAHLGRVLPVTCVKDFGMVELWDDRAVQVVPNDGRRVDEAGAELLRQLEQETSLRRAVSERAERIRKELLAEKQKVTKLRVAGSAFVHNVQSHNVAGAGELSVQTDASFRELKQVLADAGTIQENDTAGCAALACEAATSAST